MSESGYIQGAADDSEAWSHGLTPPLFWRNKGKFLGADEEHMVDIIRHIIQNDPASTGENHSAVKLGSTNLHVGDLSETLSMDPYDGTIICSNTSPQSQDQEDEKEKSRTLYLHCSVGKLGSRALRSNLLRIPSFIASLNKSYGQPKILFVSSPGRDLSVGIALVVLCLFFDDDCKPFFVRNTGYFRLLTL